MQREPETRAELEASIRDGCSPEFLFFWAHTPREDGVLGRECLSQWYPAHFTIDGIDYVSAEHFMMAEKARLFGDVQALARIVGARDPAEAKKLGRSVRGFDEAHWQAKRFEIVVAGSIGKFGQNRRLREFLRDTRGTVLVEASPRDTIWGIGLGAENPRARRPHEWRGLNLLGFALMRARRDLSARFANPG